MKISQLVCSLLLLLVQHSYAQSIDNKKEISRILTTYSRSVVAKDSVTFYRLFNDGLVTWCAALKDRSQAKEVERKGATSAGSNYFSRSYKAFMRSLFRYDSTEDKFDNIRIVDDGTVASVTMDYSFWGNNKMTNWGNKYLGLIKRDGHWKITSVIYSLELSHYVEQPTLTERQKVTLPGGGH